MVLLSSLLSSPTGSAVPAARSYGGFPLSMHALASYSSAPGETTFADKYSIVLNTYKRRQLMEDSLAHHAACASVDRIHVVWSEAAPAPANYVADSGVEVVFHAMATNSLNNRFRALPGVRTEAVLSLDDDLRIPCKDLDAAFATWRRSPQQLVGWFPRMVERSRSLDTCRYTYMRPFWTIVQARQVNIVLTKGAFMHRDWLKAYEDLVPDAVKHYVDEHRNCEDLAMQVLVSTVTQTGPEVAMSYNVRDLGASAALAISQKEGHLEARQECLCAFEDILGGALPLRSKSLSLREAAALLWQQICISVT
ncbi:unnamed protein product [Pedinophyceae sp. YPF-701]|nr:unnamed protein product [Pedinophyceae sp. YPF-701]